jgi:hypothetical protein
VYADWLTSRADPRGEYIALAIRAEQEDDDDLRAAASLVSRAHPEWRPDARELEWGRRRGLVERLLVEARRWVRERDRLRAAAPLLRELELAFQSDDVDPGELGRSVAGLRLRRLALIGDGIPSCRALLAEAACRSLRQLFAYRASETDLGAAIADTPALDELRERDLEGDAQTFVALAGARLPALEELGAYGDGFAAAFDALAAWPPFASLRSLRADQVGEQTGERLFATPLGRLEKILIGGSVSEGTPAWAAQLRELVVSTDQGLPLGEWPLGRLRRLEIWSRRGMFAPLARTPALAGLDRLTIHAPAPDDALAAVARPVWTGLRSLHLIGRRAGAALDASTLGELRTLRVEADHGGREVVASIVRNPAFRRLRRLELVGCALDDAAARELAAGRFDDLLAIDLADNKGIGPDGVAALRTRFPILGL